MFFKINTLLSGILFVLYFASCSPQHQLRDGHYKLIEQGGKPKKVFIQTAEDSLVIYKDNQVHETPLHADSKLIRESFDLDIITILFKYRPSISNLPRQLTTDFNGNVYTGYRIDRFINYTEETPAGPRKSVKHRALTVGVFGGLGGTSVTPWTTNNGTTDEYNGLVLSRGFAMMVGVNSLTIGFGIGWDSLTDRDKNTWIYQNKPWYGLSLGLSVN
jgi:hypothetical protein